MEEAIEDMRWLDGIYSIMEMSLSKLKDLVKDTREPLLLAVCEHKELDTMSD